MRQVSTDAPILIVGAGGYIASRLIPALLSRGYKVRCLVRQAERLADRPWRNAVQVCTADLLQPQDIEPTLLGVRTAYYLVHSMASGRHYSKLDVNLARNFIQAASSAGLEHILYLGGLADASTRLSPHMRSRIETGEALREGSVPVTEFRAGVIIGPGSISFEMIRFITEQFPLLPGPAWLQNLSQPTAVEDVIAYLLAGLETFPGHGQVVEIGGQDVMTHAESMLGYARQRGLKRSIITLPPFLPAGFIAPLVGWLTPVPAAIARPLIQALQASSMVRVNNASLLYPSIRPMNYTQALERALAALHPEGIDLALPIGKQQDSIKQEGFLIDIRQAEVNEPPELVFARLASLGGEAGWQFADPLWRLRGWIDRLLGGPGLRGREAVLQQGKVVDYYRVDAIQPGSLLRLRAELKAPGQGWMEWRLTPQGNSTRLVQIAWFAPRGLPGFLYWYLLAPIHRFVFRGLLARLTKSNNSKPSH